MTTEANPRVRGLGPSRSEVLEHLRATGVAEPVAAIAVAVGLHENTTRFHLDALIEAGLVHREAESRQQPGRPRVLYRADPAPTETHYQDLAAAMVRHFAGPMEDRGLLAEQAGMAWGSELLAEQDEAASVAGPEPMPRLVAVLARMGYQPELFAGPQPRIELRPCPYSQLAGEDPTTICQLHLGLIRGLMSATDPWEVTALEPYATPERCIVRFAQKAAS